MSLPHYEIWVAGTRFLLKFKEVDTEYGSWGYVSCTDPATITISRGIDDQLRRETLLHEIIHAIDKIGLDFSNCVSRSLCDKNEFPRLEEPQVCVFSRMLWMTLADPRNAAVMEWMIRGKAKD